MKKVDLGMISEKRYEKCSRVFENSTVEYHRPSRRVVTEGLVMENRGKFRVFNGSGIVSSQSLDISTGRAGNRCSTADTWADPQLLSS